MARSSGDAVSNNLAILYDMLTRGVYHCLNEVPNNCELLKGLNGFRLDGSYCDVTIYVEGRAFQCHRAVLASVSEYFHRLFDCTLEESSSQMNNFTLPDIDAKSFNILLKFIYLGLRPDFKEDVIHGLLRSSKVLGLQNVNRMCVQYIMSAASFFSPVTTFELFHLACGLNERRLMNRLSEYYVAFLEDFTQEDSFLEMTYDCLNHVLQQYRASAVHFVKENFLLDALVRWVFHNFQGRRYYFLALIDEVDFNKISEDCAEFLLKKYKANSRTKLKSVNQAKALKKFVLDSFSRLENFISHDDTMPASYEDPRLEITPSIYVFGREVFNERYKDMYTVFSLSKPDSCNTETATNSSDLSSAGDRSVETNWVISCTYKMSTKHALVSSSKLNLIYCLFDTGIFRAYNTVDLSSATYTELASLSQSYNGEYLRSYCSKYTGACGTGDGDIYFSDTRKIHRYNSHLNKWFRVDDQAGVEKSSFFVHDNLLYVIGGENPEGKILDNYIRTYDGRTSKWLELSRPEIMPYRWCNASCVMDGKIYVFDGLQLKVFDPVAGRWMYFDQAKLYYLWPAHSCSGRLKMISYKNEVFIFQSFDGEYLAYNSVRNTVRKSRMPYYTGYRYFCFQNVISFEFMEP